MQISLTLNGKATMVDVPGDMRLIDLLREELHLSGTKEGCGIGECGACTVIVNGVAVHACLTVAGQLEGSNLITIEGLEQNHILDVVQEAFVRNGAIQCGFCTAGMVMSAKALLMRCECPTDEEIIRAISGNICRCTGYREIKAAIRDAASVLNGTGW